MALSQQGICYEERLAQLQLTTLETRRMRGEVFKIL